MILWAFFILVFLCLILSTWRQTATIFFQHHMQDFEDLELGLILAERANPYDLRHAALKETLERGDVTIIGKKSDILKIYEELQEFLIYHQFKSPFCLCTEIMIPKEDYLQNQ